MLGGTWASVGLGDAEGLVLLPICSLAVLAAVKDQATEGAVEEFLLAALAVVAGFVPDARGGLLLLGRHMNEGIKTGGGQSSDKSPLPATRGVESLLSLKRG